jgi:septum formation protein
VACELVKRLVSEEPIVLASSSPRRRRILEGLDLEFVVDVPDVDESCEDGESPQEHVRRLAWLKAATVAGRYEKGTIIAGDTIVLLDDRILGKPADGREAVEMLKALRGRRHEVLTGVAVLRCSDGAGAVGVESTEVLVRLLSDEDIKGYVESGEPLDKAGAYAIQDCGAAIVEEVRGCFYNVVGLPVALLCDALSRLTSMDQS